MKSKSKEKEKARYLRKVEGHSVRQIASELGVSKASVSSWVKDIKLSAKVKRSLDERNPSSSKFRGKRIASTVVHERAKAARREHQKKGFDEAKTCNLHLVGCMLFWAEGSKRRNDVRFTNTDPDMMMLFLRFLRECFAVPDEKIAVTCRSHTLSDYTLEQVETYWLTTLGLRNTCLRKGATETRIPRHKSVKYPYGICTIGVYDTEITQRIYGAIKKYAGMSLDDKWL